MVEAFEEFWRFSLALYGRPWVAPACLELQDRHGKDVILLLYACWLGASGRDRLDQAGLAAAAAVQQPWRQEVVERLRATRQALKGIAGAETLYQRMKAIELDAERVAHQRLAPLAPAADPQRGAVARRDDARANLALYADEAAAAVIAVALGEPDS